MIPYAQARALVVGACTPRPPRRLDLDDALGCVLAETVVAADPVPPFANTAMDGYAVRAADIAGATEERPVRLRVVGTLAAGSAPTTPVGPGEALRIMTGAPFPSGADTVAIVEVTEPAGEDVWVRAPAPAGLHVRGAGDDLPAGAEVFPAGTLLGPGHLGVLASVGLGRVLAHPPVSVGVLSTGDELVDAGVGGPLQPGQIRDANRHTLLGLLRRDGAVALDLGIVGDDEAAIRRTLQQGVAACDAVIASGGVSMGDFDYVKKVLDELADMHWMQVAIRPAKPLAFGTVGDTPVFGLPGNPVSSMVSYELFARPALRRLSGHPDGELDRPRIRAVADEPLRRRPDQRVDHLRVRARFGPDGRCHVTPAGGQGSHQLRAMAVADGLAVVAEGDGIPAGGEVEVMLLR